MKKLIREVKLRMFQDDANGEYGLAHYQTIQSDVSFNAFWDGIGIFHDVFEHYFEHEHKYFRGDAAMNVGGEMAAMGHAWYYYDVLGLGQIRYSSHNPFAEAIRESTESELRDAILYGYCSFGYELISHIPNQPTSYSCELEHQINRMWRNVKNVHYEGNEEDEKEFSQAYKKSISLGKIANLYRWGYKQAERYVPDNWENRSTLRNFIAFWNEFCKKNDAKELYNLGMRNVVFKIYKENDIISWKTFAYVENQKIQIHKHFNVYDDIYSILE